MQYVVSTFYRRRWGKGWRSISHTYGPYNLTDAKRHKKAMIDENKDLLKSEKEKGNIVYISVEPLRNEDNNYGEDNG